MITFAAFHMDIGKKDLAGIHHVVSSVTVKKESRLYLETALASCRARHPGCRTVVLTDQATSYPTNAGYEVFRVVGLDPARSAFLCETSFCSGTGLSPSAIRLKEMINATPMSLNGNENSSALTHWTSKRCCRGVSRGRNRSLYLFCITK